MFSAQCSQLSHWHLAVHVDLARWVQWIWNIWKYFPLFRAISCPTDSQMGQIGWMKSYLIQKKWKKINLTSDLFSIYSIPSVQRNFSFVRSTNCHRELSTRYTVRRCHRSSNSGGVAIHTTIFFWWYCSHLFNFYVNALIHRRSIVSSFASCVLFRCEKKGSHWLILIKFCCNYFLCIPLSERCICPLWPGQNARGNKSVASIPKTCKRSQAKSTTRFVE